MTSGIDALIGKTLAAVTLAGDNETITFKTSCGETYQMFHGQDCCESVSVEDVVGDLGDLVDSPILQAEEVSSENEPPPRYAESYTWTFYKLATIKGGVTIRWLGRSNGYYSERVDFVKVS